MNFKKIFLFNLLFLTFLYSSNKTEVLNNENLIINKVKESFDDLLNYKFMHLEERNRVLQVGNKLVELIDSKDKNNLKKILDAWNLSEKKLLILQALSFVDDKFKDLNYRRLQQIRLDLLADFCLEYNLDAKHINKKFKSIINKKIYSKYKNLFKMDLNNFNIPFFLDYSNFISSYQKKGYQNFLLDETVANNLIKEFSESKKNIKLNLLYLDDTGFIKKILKNSWKKELNNKIEIIDLFIQNILKIKITCLYNKEMLEKFDLAFACKDSSKKMLVIKHYVLLSKNSFKELLQNSKTSNLFNSYLDLILFYLNDTDALQSSLFIFNFFKIYSEINSLETKNDGPIPYINLGGNKKLLEVTSDIKEILDIILKNIHEKMGTGPGWFKKLFQGKFPVSEQTLNFALSLLEEKFIN
ncbi:hypothetical protein GF385_01720 [Candidatus Dependentiae bacterium]|nr:hypothetical protein [Candidatus Dependentiae bacterium]